MSSGFRISAFRASTCGLVHLAAWSLFSTMNLIAALAAMRPSACEPEENLWLEAPEASPAQNRPLTVAMFA